MAAERQRRHDARERAFLAFMPSWQKKYVA